MRLMIAIIFILAALAFVFVGCAKQRAVGQTPAVGAPRLLASATLNSQPSTVVTPSPYFILTRSATDPNVWSPQFAPGSDPRVLTNYVWTIQSATNVTGPYHDEDQWLSTNHPPELQFRPAWPNYFFRLHGTTNK